MKNSRSVFSARYLAALRTHLRGRKAGGDRARGLGRTALVHGWVTLDLARIHEKAMATLASAHDSDDWDNTSVERAGFFFTQALIPLETAQRATRETNRLLRRHNTTLRHHAIALTAGTRRLEREITRRKRAESALRRGREQYQTLFLESQVMQRKLRQLARQILSAQEEERKEISRELHDEVVQTLVGINVQLSALGEGASQGARVLKAKIARTQRLVENSVKAVHRFARELRPAVLDDLGLIPALHAYCRGLAARKRIEIQLTAFSGVEAVGSARRIVLYRVAQEALTNVVRHAQATQVTVIISALPAAVRMAIHDNGKSFPVAKTLQAATNRRLGLVGMKERVEMVGGRLAIESTPGRGTTVCAEVPFAPGKGEK